ncbi:hypothetical protein [Sphingobacterium chungjuense]|uniref:hypothetical protein n=1 Tax=Sphingobacterium chungjuense TaxID=2675553 RepID=UPI001407E4A5|nr:hypothetical protein [Sphingobacterium chungjuense]
MKTLLRLILTSIISTVGLFAALSMKEPWIGYAIAFCAWLLFIWTITSGSRR